MAGVFERAQSAAHDRRALDRERFEAGPAEVGLQDQRVVAGAENDAVVELSHRGYSGLAS